MMGSKRDRVRKRLLPWCNGTPSYLTLHPTAGYPPSSVVWLSITLPNCIALVEFTQGNFKVSLCSGSQQAELVRGRKLRNAEKYYGPASPMDP
eukprot:3530166-Amphidinium_carterae.2